MIDLVGHFADNPACLSRAPSVYSVACILVCKEY